MKKALVLVVLVALLFGGSLVERVDAVAVCDMCDAPAPEDTDPCAPDFECRNDLEAGDGKKQGVCQEPGKTQICNPLGSTNFVGIINNILNLLFNFALVLSPLMIVVAGIMFVTAGGSPDRISTAMRILLWTAVGFVIILLARGLVVVIRAIIGF